MGPLILGDWLLRCIGCRGLLHTIGFLCRYLSGLKNGESLPFWSDVDGPSWSDGDARVIESSSKYLLPLDIFHVSLLVFLGIDVIYWGWLVVAELKGMKAMGIRVERMCEQS